MCVKTSSLALNYPVEVKKMRDARRKKVAIFCKTGNEVKAKGLPQ